MKVARKNTVFPFFTGAFDDAVMKDLFENNSTYTSPAVNVKETAESFDLEVLAPGFDKKDFSIEVENEVLTIKGELKKEESETKETYTRREFRSQSFKRTFTLPKSGAVIDKIEAKYNNGVLHIAIPKTKKELLTKTVEIM